MSLKAHRYYRLLPAGPAHHICRRQGNPAVVGEMWFWKRKSDRRRWVRTTCRTAALLTAGRSTLSGAVVDISRGGCLFKPMRPPLFVEPGGTLTVLGARLPVRLLCLGRQGQQLCFTRMLTERQYSDILFVLERERLGIAHDSDATLWLGGRDLRPPLERDPT